MPSTSTGRRANFGDSGALWSEAVSQLDLSELPLGHTLVDSTYSDNGNLRTLRRPCLKTATHPFSSSGTSTGRAESNMLT